MRQLQLSRLGKVVAAAGIAGADLGSSQQDILLFPLVICGCNALVVHGGDRTVGTDIVRRQDVDPDSISARVVVLMAHVESHLVVVLKDAVFFETETGRMLAVDQIRIKRFAYPVAPVYENVVENVAVIDGFPFLYYDMSTFLIGFYRSPPLCGSRSRRPSMDSWPGRTLRTK